MCGGILANNMAIISCRWHNKAASMLFIIIILLLLCFINSSSTSVRFVEGADEGARLELIHLHSLPAGRQTRPPNPQLERLKDSLERDGIRQQAIDHLHRLRGRRRRRLLRQQQMNIQATSSAGDDSIEMPMRSGADYGAGQYLVSLKVGSPAQKLLVIADTGSELTWMNCRHRCGRDWRRHRRTPRHRRVFCADHSSSFTTFPCSSTTCKIDLMNLFSLARCPTPLTPCAYDYRYADGSAAVGIFADETITVQLTNGRKAKLRNVLVGCSEASRGETLQLADGVLGMGYSNHSFAIKAADMFGGKFSYCLVDHLSPRNVSNYLVFGTTLHHTHTMQYTPLALGVIGSFYAINVEGISVGGVMLNIPNQVWDINGAGGTILDSGSSLTALTRPAYQPVVASLWLPLSSKFKRVHVEIGALEYCFNSTGFEESVVPRLELHLADGVGFRPPVRNYVIDAADGVKCLGIVSADWPATSVIGNIMQQNHIWEFDLINHRLGFSPSTCT